MGRYRRLLSALTANQNAGFVTVPSENKINLFIYLFIYIYMSFAGWEVRIVKNCDRGLEMLPEAAGRGQHIQGRILFCVQKTVSIFVNTRTKSH